MDERDEYLTTRDAADLAKVSQETIIDWCQSNYIKCTKIRKNNRWRISRLSLVAFLLGQNPADH